MKRKRTNWDLVPWTPFEPASPLPNDALDALDPCTARFNNSRYQVTIYLVEVAPFGKIAHLSFKTHDRQARHDWRDMQRIKNEICGPECDAVEIYPAESKLVDSANQYHLFVFQNFQLPFGFQTRLVGDGDWNKSKQRPWPKGERPADALSPDEFQAIVDMKIKERETV